MRLEPFAVSARAGQRPASREKKRAAYRATALRAVRVNDNPAIAPAPASTAPVAVQVNGRLVGLALKVGGRFVFFSGGHPTDDCDGKTFTSLAAIREAAGEIPSPAA
jgi:hypothetical protein